MSDSPTSPARKEWSRSWKVMPLVLLVNSLLNWLCLKQWHIMAGMQRTKKSSCFITAHWLCSSTFPRHQWLLAIHQRCKETILLIFLVADVAVLLLMRTLSALWGFQGVAFDFILCVKYLNMCFVCRILQCTVCLHFVSQKNPVPHIKPLAFCKDN